MEVVKIKYNAFLQALTTLKEAIDLMEDPKYADIPKTTQDSAIQRFEYTIDSFWKFIKIYLQEKESVDTAASPRKILKQAAAAGIINEQELQLLLETISDRNLTSHAYNEDIAETISERIQTHYNVMLSVITRLKKHI